MQSPYQPDPHGQQQMMYTHQSNGSGLVNPQDTGNSNNGSSNSQPQGLLPQDGNDIVPVDNGDDPSQQQQDSTFAKSATTLRYESLLPTGGHFGAAASIASEVSPSAGLISGPFANVTQGLDGHYRNVLMAYWQETITSIERDEHEFKVHQLPLARIKKVMKADEDVKMISAEAPILFAKGCDIFITELTMRAWIHAEMNKRRTLQRSDIASALQKSDMFDFLIDIVPREEALPSSRKPGGSNHHSQHHHVPPPPPPPASATTAPVRQHPHMGMDMSPIPQSAPVGSETGYNENNGGSNYPGIPNARYDPYSQGNGGGTPYRQPNPGPPPPTSQQMNSSSSHTPSLDHSENSGLQIYQPSEHHHQQQQQQQQPTQDQRPRITHTGSSGSSSSAASPSGGSALNQQSQPHQQQQQQGGQGPPSSSSQNQQRQQQGQVFSDSIDPYSQHQLYGNLDMVYQPYQPY